VRDASPVRRVVLVHDYLTQRGGAERLVLAMLEAFPGARLVTSVYAPDLTFPEFRAYDVETLLPRIPVIGSDPRFGLPILAPLFSCHQIRDADVVLCSSTGWAHGIGTTAPKIVYCNTPARWLYESADYTHDRGIATRVAVATAKLALTRWDKRAAASAAMYLANSTTVAARIRRVYGLEARVVHPAMTLDASAAQAPVAGVEPGFLLTVARGRGYKNTDIVIEAARVCNLPLVVVGDGGLTNLDDSQMRWLYANCRALVAAAYEDFGLTPVEAMAFGKPVVALRRGGYLDTVVDGVTGLFFDEARPDAIAEALDRLSGTAFDTERIRRHTRAFSLDAFVARLRECAAEVVS
jgi:glycosyltransferase involved in cell wall biosynthesis